MKDFLSFVILVVIVGVDTGLRLAEYNTPRCCILF